MDYQLTKDADKFICTVYTEYLARRKDGLSKRKAGDFANAQEWEPALFPDWNPSDIGTTISELSHAKLVKRYLGHGFILNDAAIIYMENRFPNGLSQVLDWLGKIKSAIPFA